MGGSGRKVAGVSGRPAVELRPKKAFYVETVNGPETVEAISRLEPDVVIQEAAGILRRQVFEIARIGTLNLHSGIAPLLRGQDPVFWALSIMLLYVLTAWDFIPMLFPFPVLAMSILTALIGNLMFVYLSMYGLMKRGYYDLVAPMFISPVYWVLQSIAAWKAFYQLLVKPHYWEKTEHGLGTDHSEEAAA